MDKGKVWIHRVTGLVFVYVPPGSFMMGGDTHEDEMPIHEVTFRHGFWIGKYPVTNAQYERFMKQGKGREPDEWGNSRFNAPEQPVVGVSGREAYTYCRWASEVLLGGDELPPGGAEGIGLPSEAEWEYAARGPENREYPWGNELPTPGLVNFNENMGQTTPVGLYPNGASWVGAMDMAGNVWEWCEDPWHENYAKGPEDGSVWTTGGEKTHRVVRGGGWFDDAEVIRPTYRGRYHSELRCLDQGFRVVMRQERERKET